jgi:hypothetical protein
MSDMAGNKDLSTQQVEGFYKDNKDFFDVFANSGAAGDRSSFKSDMSAKKQQ